MSQTKHYAIRGGMKGRERLRVLARAMHASTTSLIDRLGLRNGMTCLDVGCGGGDVTRELARRVAPAGRAVGIDIDETTLELARQESKTAGIDNVEFRKADIRTHELEARFDVVYTRFLLTHLSDPDRVVARLVRHLEPGGCLAVEDIDFSGSYTWPESDAYLRFHDLYCAVVRRRGGDPELGKRVPLLLANNGLENVEMHIVQPMGLRGEVKLLHAITMENIAEAVLKDGLASGAVIEATVEELYRVAADPNTVAGLPRVVQAWGRRPVR